MHFLLFVVQQTDTIMSCAILVMYINYQYKDGKNHLAVAYSDQKGKKYSLRPKNYTAMIHVVYGHVDPYVIDYICAHYTHHHNY